MAAETPAQKSARLQAEARAIRERRLYEARSTKATGIAEGKGTKPPAKPKSLFDAINGALTGRK